MEPITKRYATAKIAKELHEDVQRLLWSLLDAFLSERVESDYLQVFELSSMRIGGELLKRSYTDKNYPLGRERKVSLV